MDDESYNYEDGDDDDGSNYESESEEPQPMLRPQFTTEAQTFKIELGHTINLPCHVDRLGECELENSISRGALKCESTLFLVIVAMRMTP